MRRLFISVAIILAAQAANALEVRVLLPLYIAQQTPGAFGSLWVSQFAAHNGSATRSYIIERCAPNEGCPLDLRSDEELLPNETETALPARYPVPASSVGGATVWLSTEASDDRADNVTFGLRVVDVSRAATGAGTEVPVVRESQFRTTTIHLLNIPVDSLFRVTLRVFEMNLAEADFTVRIFDQASNALIAQERITTTTGGLPPQRFTPAFAQLSDVVGGAGPQVTHLRIEIEPLTPGIAFWSYVSVSNNDSQQVTLVTPQ